MNYTSYYHIYGYHFGRRILAVNCQLLTFIAANLHKALALFSEACIKIPKIYYK